MASVQHISTYIKAKIYFEGQNNSQLVYSVESLLYFTSKATYISDVLFELKKRGVLNKIELENTNIDAEFKTSDKTEINNQLERFGITPILRKTVYEPFKFWKFTLEVNKEKVGLLQKELKEEIRKFKEPKNKEEKSEYFYKFLTPYSYEKQRKIILKEFIHLYRINENKLIILRFKEIISKHPEYSIHPLYLLLCLKDEELIDVIFISNKKVGFDDYTYAGIEITDKFLQENNLDDSNLPDLARSSLSVNELENKIVPKDIKPPIDEVKLSQFYELIKEAKKFKYFRHKKNNDKRIFYGKESFEVPQHLAGIMGILIERYPNNVPLETLTLEGGVKGNSLITQVAKQYVSYVNKQSDFQFKRKFINSPRSSEVYSLNHEK